ncbi:MAG: type II secretion system F family protein [Anaerolineae bacterium]
MSSISFHQYYTYSMYIAIFGVVICMLIFFWPTPEWVNEDYRITGNEEEAVTGKDRKQALFRIFALMLVMAALAGLFTVVGSLPFSFSLILGVAIVMMLYPTIRTQIERARQRKGRQEALAFTEFIAGRMSAQAPLFEALENLHQEFLDGKRDLDIVGEDLGELIRRVRLGTPLGNELARITHKFEDLHSIKYILTSYRLMVEAEMGQEAEIYQANDLSEAQTISDQLAGTLETEMSTATMSRIVMFFLIGGMIGFLVFFGDGLGDVLVNTLPGNGVIGFSLFALYLAQTVGSKLEELPILEF